jgi:glycosyltransferase involved in cell wall biosynthesis
MRVLEICPFPYYDFSGVAEHVRNVSQRISRNHDVTIYTTSSRSDFPKQEKINGIKVESFKCFSPGDAYFFSEEMLLRLRKDEFDVVHGHFYHAFPFHFASITKCQRFVATPHFHGTGHSSFRACVMKLLKPFGKRTLERANRIVSVSAYEKAVILQQFGLDSNKVALIPNGVDLGSFSGLKKRKQCFKRILYVGCLRRYKGVEYLVEVMRKLDSNTILEVIGKGPLRYSLEKRAKDLHVLDRVRFYQDLPRQELLQKYADANAFVMLSRYEAYSLAVAEALAARTPCVVANTSALSEWVDNETCFGVNLPLSINELAKVIKNTTETCIGSKAMKKWIGTKILDWNDVVNRLEGILFN